MDMESLFGTTVFAYTSEDAIADGVMHRLSDIPELANLAREAGIKIPVIVTNGVLADVMQPPENAAARGEDIVGRTWDMLFVLAMRARESRKSVIEYTIIATMAEGHRNVKLVAVVDAMSDGSPVIKIMLPEEV